MAERNYEFRRRLNIVHSLDRRDLNVRPQNGEAVVSDGWRILVPPKPTEYIAQVGKDLQDYLFASMNVSSLLIREMRGAHAASSTGVIRLTTKAESPDLGDGLTAPRSYRIIARPEAIVICGCDERGTAQGCYYLEDLMNLREAPFLRQIDEVRSPVFSPRMVHSGWGIDQFPDPHLNAIAHAGMDAILVFVRSVNMTTCGYLDINNLTERAALYGLDVYLYSYLVSRVHPDDPKAAEFYESTYGALAESCPGAKGIVLVGESCEFPSKDPRTTGRLHTDPSPDDERDSRPHPGWWPCTDYPQWLSMLKGILRKHNPDLDIVFWTYNWGWAPEEDRLTLIRSLPTDISLQATFEMFERIVKDGIVTTCVDYTASFEGPGMYFSTEAQAAHERGLRLYAMSNTAGLTWDIGVIPFEPIPFQWGRRYRSLLSAHEKWGLIGLMESHHYGWWPSFVSELAKWAYWEPGVSFEEMVSRIACRDFGPDGGPLAVKAWQAWSDAIRDYVPTNEDQYGPFRVGPSYPLHLFTDPEPFPAVPYAHFGSRIVLTNYVPHRSEDLETEIDLLERMAGRWSEGISYLGRAVELAPLWKQDDASRMLGLGQFILNCVRTAIHTKRWWRMKQQLQAEQQPERANAVLDDMVRLAEREIANAEATIPLVEVDSRLGWEPSMEYMTDKSHLEWKVAQLRRVIDDEIPKYRRGLPRAT
ncbi:MAG: hypothetical protein ABSD48_16560 [Armatimonadota bacterium]|jgi:hypothetical protein